MTKVLTIHTHSHTVTCSHLSHHLCTPSATEVTIIPSLAAGDPVGVHPSCRRCSYSSFICPPEVPKIALTYSPWRRHPRSCPLTPRGGSCLLSPLCQPTAGWQLLLAPQGEAALLSLVMGWGDPGTLQAGANALWWLLLPFHCLSLCHTCPFSLCVS